MLSDEVALHEVGRRGILQSSGGPRVLRHIPDVGRTLYLQGIVQDVVPSLQLKDFHEDQSEDEEHFMSWCSPGVVPPDVGEGVDALPAVFFVFFERRGMFPW